MSLALALFIVLSSFSFARECDETELFEQKAKAEIAKNDFQTRSIYRDVQTEIEEYEQAINVCDQMRSEMALSPSTRQFWLHTGKGAEVNTKLKDIYFTAHFRDVKRDVDDFRNLLTKNLPGDLVKNKSEIEKKLKESLDIGKKSQSNVEKNCGFKDLNKKFGPIRHQGDTEWCFAVAAADLLSFKTGKQFSDLHVAVKYYNEYESDVKDSPPYKSNYVQDPNYPNRNWTEEVQPTYSLNRGWAYNALNKALSEGLCLQKDVGVPGNDTFSLKEIERLNYFMKEVKSLKCQDHDAFLTNPSNTLVLKRFFPEKNLSDLLGIFRASEKSSLFENLIEKSCNAQKLPKFEIHQYSVKDYSLARDNLERIEIAKRIDDGLDNDNPSLINFSSEVFRYNEILHRPMNHSSNIVGRRFNMEKNRCEYLVRNTYGTNCEYYNKDYECMGGQVWIPREVMAASTTHVINLNLKTF